MMPFESAPLTDVKPASQSHISSFSRPYGPRFHMDEDAPASEPAIARVELPTNAPASFDSATSAASYLASLRHKKTAEAPSATEPAATAEPAEEADEIPSTEGDAAPAIEPPISEEPEGTEPASKEPPIERPRSWTKDEDAEWQSLPRAMQHKIVAREQERDKGTRQSQNEAAEARKAAQAEQTQAEQARQQYEEKAKGALKVLEREQLRDFPDIKSMDDVKNLLTTDPLRYLQWDAHQKELVAATMAVQESDRRSADAGRTEWTKHVQSENARAAELIPELADKEKGPAFQKRAADRLVEIGFSNAELNDLASGKLKLSIYDHRLQQLVFADLKLSDLQAKEAAAKAAPKPKPAAPVVPPVIRPGASQPRGSVESSRLKDLDSKLNKSGDVKDAVALMLARRNATRRAS